MSDKLSNLYCEVFGWGQKPESEKIVLTGAPQPVKATTTSIPADEDEPKPFDLNDITQQYKAGKRWLVVVSKGGNQDYFMTNNPKSPAVVDKLGSRPHIALYISNLVGNQSPRKV